MKWYCDGLFSRDWLVLFINVTSPDKIHRVYLIFGSQNVIPYFTRQTMVFRFPATIVALILVCH